MVSFPATGDVAHGSTVGGAMLTEREVGEVGRLENTFLKGENQYLMCTVGSSCSAFTQMPSELKNELANNLHVSCTVHLGTASFTYHQNFYLDTE